MRRSLIITLLALSASGCSKREAANSMVSNDPLGRFLAESTNRVGSFPFHNTGVPISRTVQDALSNTYDGRVFYLQPYRFTNLEVLEVRTIDPQQPELPWRLRGSVLMLIGTSSGQRVVQFQTVEGAWWYHVYDIN